MRWASIAVGEHLHAALGGFQGFDLGLELGHLLAQLVPILDQLDALEQPAKHVAELIQVEGLGDHAVGPQIHGLGSLPHRAEATQDEHGAARVDLEGLAEHVHARFAGHHEIGEDQIEGWVGCPQDALGALAGLGGGDGEAFVLKQVGQRFQQNWIVIDQQQPVGWMVGRNDRGRQRMTL